MTQNFVITQPNLRPDVPPRALRVLVVDDDRDMVLSLTTLLRTEGYETRGLHNAADILHHVEAFNADVLVLDIAMPGKTGWEAAKEIRANLDKRRLVIIGISGEHTRGWDRTQSTMNGFDFYLMKPYDPNVLLTLLRWLQIQSPFSSSLTRRGAGA